MSAALFIVLDRKVNFNTVVNGKALARAEAALEAVALAQAVKPLMEFYSTNPDNLPEEVAALVTSFAEEWFTPEEGLLTLRALLAHLEDARLEEVASGAVLIDLLQFEQVLTQAATQGAQWHLEVDY